VDKRQKLPVNENTNFNIILNQHNPTRERDAHFLISIKKSKKDRKGAPRVSGRGCNSWRVDARQRSGRCVWRRAVARLGADSAVG